MFVQHSNLRCECRDCEGCDCRSLHFDFLTLLSLASGLQAGELLAEYGSENRRDRPVDGLPRAEESDRAGFGPKDGESFISIL